MTNATVRETMKINGRMRSYGIAWTNDVERGPDGYLQVRRPLPPACDLTPRQALAELERACRVNAGNAWRVDLYVRGRRVVGDVPGGDAAEWSDWDGLPWSMRLEAIRGTLEVLPGAAFDVTVA